MSKKPSYPHKLLVRLMCDFVANDDKKGLRAVRYLLVDEAGRYKLSERKALVKTLSKYLNPKQ